MKKLGLVLAAAFGILAVAPAQASPVDITYALGGVIAVPALGGAPVGPPGAGTLTLRYSALSANGSLASAILPPGALVGLSSGPVHLEGFSFMQVVGLAVGGDVITGSAMLGAGPSGLGALAGGSLMVPLAGTFMGIIHCTGATCPGFGFPISIPTPIGGLLAASLAGLVGLAPGIALAFPFAPFVVGMLGGVPITAMLTATEVSRHVVPEPTTASLLGLGMLGLAIWRVRHGRKA